MLKLIKRILCFLFGIACAADQSAPIFTPIHNMEQWSVDELSLVAYINRYRFKHGIGPLEVDGTMRDLAYERNIDNTKIDSVSHAGFPRVMSILLDKGLTGVGENLGYKYTSIETVLEAWKNSEAHNKNLLNEAWKYTGVSIYRNREEDAMYYCQLFGK